MREASNGEQDRQWMRRALDLAEGSAGLASPNPATGCVLVKSGEVVGEGFHEYDKFDHAEISALKQAGEHARGATAYITLEPCSHQGRTGPCADALVAAGVGRVVIATRDPNPNVNGQGIERLRTAGVSVECGVLAKEARRLNEAFARRIRSDHPFATLKIACSLDGRIAPAKHHAKATFWITGESAREEVHRMRHRADAVLTGVGTIAADDPMLTDRSGRPRRRPLLRAVLDTKLRTPLDSKLVGSAKEDVLIFFSRASKSSRKEFEARGIRIEEVETTLEGHLSMAHALKRLAALRMNCVLIEGGSRINSTALADDLVDRLTIFYAPILLGAGAPMTSSAIPFRPPIEVELAHFGEDFRMSALLRDPWTEVD